jgi:hypothetical protein
MSKQNQRETDPANLRSTSTKLSTKGCPVINQLCAQNGSSQMLLLDMITNGQVVKVLRFAVEPSQYDDRFAMQTVAICIGQNAATPFVLVDLHQDDDSAMLYATSIFEQMKQSGMASTDQTARWRRSLMTVVKA